MESIDLKKEQALKAISTFEEILSESFSVIVRDATIQRFEYTFEAFWKFIKEYLKEHEGIICNSPKGCFRELLPLGLMVEEEIVQLLEMTDDRNLTSILIKKKLLASYIKKCLNIVN